VDVRVGSSKEFGIKFTVEVLFTSGLLMMRDQKTNCKECSRTLVLLGMLLTASLPTVSRAGECTYPAAVQADFAERDKLPQFASGRVRDSWGPKAASYPAPEISANCEAHAWQRARVVAVAKKYIGLPYRHHHVPGYVGPDGPGLDCSNFTAWIYNYGLGIKLDSEVGRQSETAGRRLGAGESLQPGDLLFIRTVDDSRISHVAIYIDPHHVIDDHNDGVAVRKFKGWYATHLAYARRVVE
jgi:cell wall-associated NlpC family hydrolase